MTDAEKQGRQERHCARRTARMGQRVLTEDQQQLDEEVAAASRDEEVAAASRPAASAASASAPVPVASFHASWRAAFEVFGFSVDQAWAMFWPGISFEDAVERDGRYYRDRKDEGQLSVFMLHSGASQADAHFQKCAARFAEKGFAVIAIRGVDPFACSEVLRSIKVPAAFAARFAWTLSGVPFILHLLRECPDNEWVFIAEDSCWLYQQADSTSLLAIKDTAATDFPEGVFQRSVCGYQLACRCIPRNKKTRCPIDLDTGKATLQEDVKFFHPIGSKLFLVQKGWLRLVQKVSLEHDREGHWDWIISLMRTVGALRLHQPFVAGSAEHFSLVDGGRMQAAELPNASDHDA